MKVELITSRLSKKVRFPIIFIIGFEEKQVFPKNLNFISSELAKNFGNLLKSLNFKGKSEEYRILPTQNKQVPLIGVVGGGKQEKWDLEAGRRVFGKMVKIAHQLKITEMGIYWDEDFPVPAEAESLFISEMTAALEMANFKFTEFLKIENEEEKFRPVEKIHWVIPDSSREAKSQIQEGLTIGEAVNLTRRLKELPSNELTPEQFVEELKKQRKKYGWKLEVLDEKRLEKEGLNALLAVGRGSTHSPYLAIARYVPANARKKIALVGKGVTFDSGGISIKPSKSMDLMKYDMSGAAAVLGALCAISENKLPVEVIAAFPLVENMPSGTATRPGDIVKSYSGYSIEILNTDAEGRLILADALSYTIKNYEPDVVVDLATLTGAVVVALGHLSAGILGNDESLLKEFEQAGKISGDAVWPLPTWDEYGELMKSRVADIANIASQPGAGTITAAMFLKKFVGDKPWVHVDIAGTAFDAPERTYRPKGATGYGVRLLYRWIKNFHSEAEE